jgi:hypothetical protein
MKKINYENFLKKLYEYKYDKNKMKDFLTSLSCVKIINKNNNALINEYYLNKTDILKELDNVIEKINNEKIYKDYNVILLNIQLGEDFERLFEHNCKPYVLKDYRDMWIFTPFNMHDTISTKNMIELNYKNIQDYCKFKEIFNYIRKNTQSTNETSSSLKIIINQDKVEYSFELTDKNSTDKSTFEIYNYDKDLYNVFLKNTIELINHSKKLYNKDTKNFEEIFKDGFEKKMIIEKLKKDSKIQKISFFINQIVSEEKILVIVDDKEKEIEVEIAKIFGISNFINFISDLV